MQISKLTILSAVAAISTTAVAAFKPSHEHGLSLRQFMTTPTGSSLAKRGCSWGGCDACYDNVWQCVECAKGTGTEWGDIVVCLAW